jgi:hypothetical protein
MRWSERPYGPEEAKREPAKNTMSGEKKAGDLQGAKGGKP